MRPGIVQAVEDPKLLGERAGGEPHHCADLQVRL